MDDDANHKDYYGCDVDAREGIEFLMGDMGHLDQYSLVNRHKNV